MPASFGAHRTQIISALATSLTEDQSLHGEGVTAQIEAHCRAGLAGLLVAGTMGAMQLLADETYQRLIDCSVEAAAGRCELLVGVGDMSFARTRDRIRIVEKFPIQGVVAVTPGFLKFNNDELRDYYRALADLSKRPLYLYDLPSVTGVKLDFDLVVELAEHPNIAGIKCSVPWDWTRQLIDAAPSSFRVIPAQPHLVDQLIRLGVRDNLDGIYILFPRLTAELVAASEQQHWDDAALLQKDLCHISRLLPKYGVLAASAALLNARGIGGNIAPLPFRPLDEVRRREFLADPIVSERIRNEIR